MRLGVIHGVTPWKRGASDRLHVLKTATTSRAPKDRKHKNRHCHKGPRPASSKRSSASITLPAKSLDNHPLVGVDYKPEAHLWSNSPAPATPRLLWEARGRILTTPHTNLFRQLQSDPWSLLSLQHSHLPHAVLRLAPCPPTRRLTCRRIGFPPRQRRFRCCRAKAVWPCCHPTPGGGGASPPKSKATPPDQQGDHISSFLLLCFVARRSHPRQHPRKTAPRTAVEFSALQHRPDFE